ncbi:MAG: LysR substrate-binding domain-containing protein [Myxococcales bacterium]|nr:LysR substrate-binding domain-containing protein [Myxococcales bacterium]
MSEQFDDIRLKDFVFFDRLAALGSITAVAKELRLPKATASRWLSTLEERVGRALFKRTTRSVVLTESGKAFGVRVREILTVVKAAQMGMLSEVPSGLLRVSVPVPLGRMLAGPVIAEFRRRLPGVRLEIKLQNERVDLVREGFDLAIRGGPLPDSDLLARKLSTASMWLYASARFRGEATERIPVIASPGDEVLLRRARVEVASEPAVLVDDRTAVADALVWGAGLGLLPSFLGEPPRAQGALFRMNDEPVAALPVHAVYHPSQRDDPRLQTLIEEISRQLDRVL